MVYIAVEYAYRVNSVPDRDRFRSEHLLWLADLISQGHILTAGPYLDDSGALLLLDAPDTDAAVKLLADDPFVEAGIVVGIRPTEWKPVMGVFT